MVWIVILNLIILSAFFIIDLTISVPLINTFNVANIIAVMFISIIAYNTISLGLKNKNTALILVTIGFKLLFFLAYLSVVMIFLEIPNKIMFVFTFMFAYLFGATQLVYLLQKRVKE